VLERDVEKGAARFREDLRAVAKLGLHVQAPAAAVGHPGGNGELPVDESRAAEPDEDANGHRREAVPGGEEAARLVERRAHEAAVDDSRPRLVALPEGEGRLVALDSLLGGKRKMNALRVVPAPPARSIMMGRYAALYRSPPRSKCAL
jgi:hypothetical protein